MIDYKVQYYKKYKNYKKIYKMIAGNPHWKEVAKKSRTRGMDSSSTVGENKSVVNTPQQYLPVHARINTRHIPLPIQTHTKDDSVENKVHSFDIPQQYLPAHAQIKMKYIPLPIKQVSKKITSLKELSTSKPQLSIPKQHLQKSQKLKTSSYLHLTNYTSLRKFMENVNKIYKRPNGRYPLTFRCESVKVDSTWEDIVYSDDFKKTPNNYLNDLENDHIRKSLVSMISEDTWQNSIVSKVKLLADVIRDYDVLDTLKRDSYKSLKKWTGKQCVKLDSSEDLLNQKKLISDWLEGKSCTSIEFSIGYDTGEKSIETDSRNPWHTDGTCRFFINYSEIEDDPSISQENYGFTQYIQHEEVPDNLPDLMTKVRSGNLSQVYYNTHNKKDTKRAETLRFLQSIAFNPENVVDTENKKWEFHWPDLFVNDERGNVIHVPGRWHQKNPSRHEIDTIPRITGKIDFEMLTIGRQDTYYRLLQHSPEKLEKPETWRQKHEGYSKINMK